MLRICRVPGIHLSSGQDFTDKVDVEKLTTKLGCFLWHSITLVILDLI